MADTQATVTFTKRGDEWSEVVCEIEWLQDEQGDLSETMQAIEDQLPDAYWDSPDDFTITVSAQVAELVTQVENTDAAERAALDRRLNERDRQAAQVAAPEDDEPETPQSRLTDIREAMSELTADIDKTLRSVSYDAPLTPEAAARVADGVRKLQSEYNVLISNALGELANLVSEGAVMMTRAKQEHA